MSLALPIMEVKERGAIRGGSDFRSGAARRGRSKFCTPAAAREKGIHDRRPTHAARRPARGRALHTREAIRRAEVLAAPLYGPRDRRAALVLGAREVRAHHLRP